MPQKQKAPRFNITSDAKLTDELRYLSKMTKKTQIGILHEILDRMTAISVNYSSFSYWVDESGPQVMITFYGKEKLVVGEVKDPECLGDKANDVLDEKCLENEMNRLAIEAKQDVEKAKKKQKKAK